LFDEIFKVVPAMCVEVLDELEAGSVKALSQDEERAILSFPRRPWDAWIDWKMSAMEIDRLVRAVTRPYPGALTCLDTKLVTIWKGHVLKGPPCFVGMPGHVVNHLEDGSVWVLTGEGIYIVEEAEIEGEPALSPAKLFPGMQKRLGMTEGMLFSKLRELKDLKR
jgi:methionyl-tRNA formyltransferase